MLSLYGLEIVADLSTLVYDKTMNVVVDRKNKSKSPDGNPNELMPPIQAMAVGLHERNINIFLVKQNIVIKNGVEMIEETDKENISFLSYMEEVYN